MSNNDKFIRDTEFGKLMESEDYPCPKCKYFDNDIYSSTCGKITNYLCLERNGYFAKDETDENKNLQNLQK